MDNFLDSFVQALNSNDRKEQIEAIAELKKLSSSNPKNKFLIAKRCSSALLEYLSLGDEELVLQSTKLLRSISVEIESVDLIVKSGAIPKLIHLIKTTKDPQVQLNAAATIWNISVDDVHELNVAAEGGIPPLVSLLASQDEEVQHEATGALRNLSFNADNQKLIVKEGAIPFLIQNLQNVNKVNLHRNTAILLKNLCENDEHKRFIVKELGLDGTIQLLKKFDLLQILLNEKDGGQKDKFDDKGSVLLGADYTINWNDIKMTKKIGEGAYGDVYKGKYHGFTVAIKIIKREIQDRGNDKTLEELKLMRLLKHPNVVLLMGACLNPSKQLVIVTEYCHRGNLKDCLKEDELTLLKRTKLANDIIMSLNWIHAQYIVHRDLKLSNFLVTEDWNVKLSDFGLSMQYKDRNGQDIIINHFGGNVKYSPPEILRARKDKKITVFPYGEKTDVYSFGLMLYEIITTKPLFPEEVKGNKAITQYVIAGNRPEVPKEWPVSMKDLLQACWHNDPNARPKFADISESFTKVITDVMCPDPLGKKICRKLWKGQEVSKISYYVFEQVFAERTDLNFSAIKKIHIKCLNAIISDPFDDKVTLERFCNAVYWFGPISPVQFFLQNIVDILEKEWFHGFLNASRAAYIVKSKWSVKKKRKAYFLVRFNTQEPGHFTLTYIDPNGNIFHKKIHHLLNEGFAIPEFNLEAPNLIALVKLLAKTSLKLKSTCPGNPFKSLFTRYENRVSEPTLSVDDVEASF